MVTAWLPNWQLFTYRREPYRNNWRVGHGEFTLERPHYYWRPLDFPLLIAKLLRLQITKAGVPSNKVVVGTTSYGRSFAMAEAGCYGPDCTFLGSADDSQAALGPCTQTAGYASNAEIQEILANSSRVNQNFIDAASNANILVYDDTQWVGWMSNGIKTSRASLYKGLAMGGTTDWATDLQEYNDPPYVVSNWGILISDVLMGTDPSEKGPRHGNWTKLNCSD